jgi:hypothetical protein
MKGFRTYAISAVVVLTALAAAFADPAVIAAIPPRYMGLIVAGLGGLMAFLRSITSTPPGQSGQ